jgi:hypothetical protein
MPSFEKIAKILRTDKDIIRTLGPENVFDKIIEENNSKIKSCLQSLGVFSAGAREIYHALIDRVREDDVRLSKVIGNFQNMLDLAKSTAEVGKGKFLKLEKARELVLANPPKKILQFLGYKNAQDLVNNEDIFEIFAGLRFVEKNDWLNKVFFKPYENLIPDDFEEREIQAKVLSEKWVKAAEQFLKKKYHNLSHLKELGFVFIIPVSIDVPGAALRDFSLALHYFHEIKFYSDLVEKYMIEPDFAPRFTGLLRGDVVNVRPAESKVERTWLIIQRYLAKDDENDWRLFYPHINPEALHWQKAESDIVKLSREKKLGLEFWNGLGPVGDFFKDELGIEILVSFNIVDTVMALFKEKEMVKYLYHHQEALWNKIFIELYGEEKFKELLINNFDNGYFQINNK